MNKKATIVELYRFKEVTYYSIQIGDNLPLGLEFLKKHSSHKDMDLLMSWIKKIGDDRLASVHFFRQEREAHALPPPSNITHKSCSLRWYCLRLNYKSVILFNGGIKTARKAQDCKNVSSHFEQAGKLSLRIWEEIDNEEVTIDSSDNLIVRENYYFEL